MTPLLLSLYLLGALATFAWVADWRTWRAVGVAVVWPVVWLVRATSWRSA